MKPPKFEYHCPTDLKEAAGLLADLEDAKLIAGGQSLVATMNMRLSFPEHLVDLRRVPGLRDIRREDGALRIGGCTTQALVERSATVAEQVPLLARAVPLIGHFQIRNRGTVGGSIAHADAAAEIPAVARALDARIEAFSPRGTRTIAAEDFFVHLWTTALEPDEIVTAVTFPTWAGRSGFGVEEFARRSGDFAIAGACVAISLDDAGQVTRSAISLFGMGITVLRAPGAEALLIGSAAADVDPDEVGRRAVGDLEEVPGDLHASSDNRRQIGAVVVARALRRAIQEATGA